MSGQKIAGRASPRSRVSSTAARSIALSSGVRARIAASPGAAASGCGAFSSEVEAGMRLFLFDLRRLVQRPFETCPA